MMAAMRAAQALSEEIVFDRLIDRVMATMLAQAGARHGRLLLIQNEVAEIRAIGRSVDQAVIVEQANRAPSAQDVPLAVLDAVLRGKKAILSEDGALLCLPLVKRGALIGAVVLEKGSFAPERVAILEILADQAAISLETARIYAELIAGNALRAQTEASLRRARAELARTSHLTVMGSLAASIAHEINQPLAVIANNAGAGLRWLRKAEPNVAEAIASLSDIRDDGLRAGGIVKALRALAKQAPVNLSPTNIDDIIREVLTLMSSEIEAKRVHMTLRLETGAQQIFGDPVQLQQLVLNLITNAVEAMEAWDAKHVLVTSALEDGAVVVQIRDTGPGLSQQAVDQIFDPFYTTKPDGMGMGLAISRSIIEAHGGNLDAIVEPGGGTSFVFRLPLMAGV